MKRLLPLLSAIAALLLVIGPDYAPTIWAQVTGGFLETFEGSPITPQPWQQAETWSAVGDAAPIVGIVVPEVGAAFLAVANVRHARQVNVTKVL